ncbi:hypothetical protein Glove_109g302 [Diversispora epigaea]|uniref:Uncharacterized protein n=1 Tax=Diversispora epigaea TaxID=1348612 RepID=A0A397JBJ6_9GLOM|nr:hypothetical protein Glove_109g302 [Diversispora epigaea]
MPYEDKGYHTRMKDEKSKLPSGTGKICHAPDINFLENALLVLTAPAEYSVKSIGILRECVYNADYWASKKLKFIIEAAIYCMQILKEHFCVLKGANNNHEIEIRGKLNHQ